MIRRGVVVLAALVATPLLARDSVAGPDWNAVADVDQIVALTRDEDGSPRETTIWLVVVDGRGYIRTSRSTTWGGNVVRDPDISLRIEGTEYPLRAVFVEDEELRGRVVAAFREKYGLVDGLLQIFRGGRPHIMRLDARVD